MESKSKKKDKKSAKKEKKNKEAEEKISKKQKTSDDTAKVISKDVEKSTPLKRGDDSKENGIDSKPEQKLSLLDELRQIDDRRQDQMNQGIEELEEEEEDLGAINIKKKHVIMTRRDCPYLSTIKRHLLDFDFEKLCSISLSNLNVYACLVCGKYFQGRGKSTYAYFHALECNHHVFINLHNGKVFSLPDNYEVDDISLNDIKYNLRPLYQKEDVEKLDKNVNYSRALDGTDYLPGCIGLNNIKSTDYVNVIIQGLCRVSDLRDFFIFYEYKQYTSDVFDFKTLLTKRLAELIRKIWNPRNFKGHVSPHEIMQAISLRSGKQFRIDKQGDPLHLLRWLLDTIDKELVRLVGKQKSIVAECFQGELQIDEYVAANNNKDGNKTTEFSKSTYQKSFFFLTLDIPPPPLYKEDADKSIIPHIPIFTLLKKYDGVTFQEYEKGKKNFKILKMPKYLIIHLKRFSKNNFFMEKNPTIVSFPLNNLDFKQYMRIENELPSMKYNLMANICHEGKPNGGFYKIHVKHKASNQWFEIQDLHITPVMPQLVCLSEAYIQIYELIEE